MGSNNVGTEPRENGSETGRIGQETLKPRPKEYVTFVTQYVQEIETAGNGIRNATKEKTTSFQISSLMRTITGGRGIPAKRNK